MLELEKKLIFIYSVIGSLIGCCNFYFGLMKSKGITLNIKVLLLLLVIYIFIFIAFYFVFIFSVTFAMNLYPEDFITAQLIANIPNYIVVYCGFKMLKKE